MKENYPMNKASFLNDFSFAENNIKTSVVLETPFSKEIQIVLKENLEMKEHKAPFPIIVHILEGEVNFSVEEQIFTLEKGNIITLDANVPHSLLATKNALIRLTLFKSDSFERIQKVVNK